MGVERAEIVTASDIDLGRLEPWPARSMPETLERLTAPGAPFEMTPVEVRGRSVRAYVHAKPHLRAVFDESRRFGARDLLLFDDERLSFEAHWRAASALGRALVDGFGLQKGDRVAIAMRNFPEWSICAWATIAAGGVLVPLNAWEPGPALARMIADSGARVAIVDPERLDRLLGEPAGDARMILARADGVPPPGVTHLRDLIGRPADYARLPNSAIPDPDLQPEDLATIFYTSGTTGAAKGAVGTHRNLVTNLVNIGFRAARAAVRRGEAWPPPPAAPGAARVQLLPLPFFHVTGFHSTLVPALANGTTLSLMYKWETQAALELVERQRINALTLVPTLAWQLVDALADSPRDLSSVDTVSYGGAAAAPELAARVRAAFPRAYPGQGYGATETSSLTAANSAEDMLARPGSVGVAVPCCDLRVVGDDGKDATLDAAGELWVRGPNVVGGYWNAPEATAAAFVDGWYRTGDIVRIDAEGFITILDRAKDMLIRGGENIYCVEIEDVLMSHPAVAEAAVFGAPERVLGEIVAAVVRLRPGHDATPDAIRAHVAARLAAHKTPVLLTLRAEPFPRNAAGKALKRELRDEMLAGLAETEA